MRPLLLVVEPGDGGGVGEDGAGDDPLGEVVLRGRRLGEVDRRDRVTEEHHGGDAGLLQLGHEPGRGLRQLGEVEQVGLVDLGLPPVLGALLVHDRGDPVEHRAGPARSGRCRTPASRCASWGRRPTGRACCSAPG